MAETKELKYSGVPVFMDGRQFIIPSLSVRQFKESMALLMADAGVVQEDLVVAIASGNHGKVAELRGKIEDHMNKLVPIIGMAIRRNYPEVTDENLFDMLDIETFREALKAVQGGSGMKRVTPGE